MLTKNLSVIMICCLFGCLVKCQAADSNDVYSVIEQYFTQRQNDERVTVTITTDGLKQADPNRLLDSLNTYVKIEDISIRRSAVFYLYKKVAELHPTKEIKQKYVNILVEGLVSNSDIDRPLHWQYEDNLLDFTHDCYSESAKVLLMQSLDVNRPSKELIRVCGVANIREALPRLDEIITDNKYGNTIIWSARLARARIGVKEDIEYCINSIESRIDKNNGYRLLDDLGYIRQPESIESLKKFALSDNRLMGLMEGDPGELYASYIIDILIESLEGFPVERKAGRGYRDNDIETARKWLSEQKTWQIIR